MNIASLETGKAENKPRVASMGRSASGHINIGNTSGGRIIYFALKTQKWKRSGTHIRFSGRCSSACTLYLALSPNQMCISPGASFYFHAPYGANKRGTAVAKSYLLRSYPKWVRSWLHKNGGLNSQAVTMNYAFARLFIRPCKVQTTLHD
jgi:hypothetical protein